MADSDDQEFNFQNNDITESTDMKVDMFANSDKLRKKEERWTYSKNNENNDDFDEVDEDLNSYKKESNDNNIHTETKDEQIHSDNDVKNNDVKNNDVQQNSANKNEEDEYESLSINEKRLRRLEYMRKLGELRDLGCKVTNYSINDDYYMMKYEYELHTSIRTKRNWMQLYNHILINLFRII